MRVMKILTATGLVVAATAMASVATASAATPTPCLQAYCLKASARLVPHPMALPPAQQRPPCTIRRRIYLAGGTFLWELVRGSIRGSTRVVGLPSGYYLWQDCEETAGAGASYVHQSTLQWAGNGRLVASLTGVTDIFAPAVYQFGSELVRLSFTPPPHATRG